MTYNSLCLPINFPGLIDHFGTHSNYCSKPLRTSPRPFPKSTILRSVGEQLAGGWGEGVGFITEGRRRLIGFYFVQPRVLTKMKTTGVNGPPPSPTQDTKG